MNTLVYFVRHAQPNFDNHDDPTRELSPKGLEDRKLVTECLLKQDVEVVLSSPFKRAVDTVKHYADNAGLPVEIIQDFRERRIADCWIEDFQGFVKDQWADFDFKLHDGESLRQVQDRNIRALNGVLEKYPGKRIAVGSHGTALGTILNYYDPDFDHARFKELQPRMPWIVRMEFDGMQLLSVEHIDPFE